MLKFILCLLVAGGAVCILWPHVDQTATRVSFSVTGLGLALAWYSILDLRKQRQERWWPHTWDRLVRATFTVVTLGLVFNLAVTPPPPPTGPSPTKSEPVEVAPPRIILFGDSVNELVVDGNWVDNAQQKLTEVVSKHFARVRCATRTYIEIRLGAEHAFSISGHLDGTAIAKILR